MGSKRRRDVADGAETAREAPAAFGLCECGERIYDHARRTLPNAGVHEYSACRVAGCGCEKFAASDGTAWPLAPAARQ